MILENFGIEMKSIDAIEILHRAWNMNKFGRR